jgi:hypothetical protein
MDDEGGQGATRARPMIELQDTPTGTDPVQLLLVSGDPGTRATVASLLAAQAPAAAIQQAEGVEEALVALEAGGVGAVLLDVACDATGRLAALQRIRSASTHCPVLVLCRRWLAACAMPSSAIGCSARCWWRATGHSSWRRTIR